MIQLIHVVVLAEDAKVDRAAGHRGVRARDGSKVPRDQGEEVARLEPRILPHGVVATPFEVSALDEVAVAQQDRAALLVGFEAQLELRHDVRAVLEEGDPAESLGFALRAVHAIALVQAAQLGVLLRLRGLHHRRQGELALALEGLALDAQQLVLVAIERRVHLGAVDLQALELQVFSVKDQSVRLQRATASPLQGLPWTYGLAAGLDGQVRRHGRDAVAGQVDAHLHVARPVRRRRVVLAELLLRRHLHWLHRVGAHHQGRRAASQPRRPARSRHCGGRQRAEAPAQGRLALREAERAAPPAREASRGHVRGQSAPQEASDGGLGGWGETRGQLGEAFSARFTCGSSSEAQLHAACLLRHMGEAGTPCGEQHDP
eukprot:scaffold53_cov193-Pinguiococcus_pyrenoidosus.AAC.64